MIGILLALQVNNWNESRKQEVLEKHYLESIKKNLASDTIYFKRRIKESQSLMNNHYQFIHNAYKKQKNTDEFRELANLLWFNSEQFVPQRSAFFEVLNSGHLNILKNRKLKDDLVALYNDYDIASKEIEEFNNFTALQLGSIDLDFAKYWKHYNYIFDENYFFNDSDWSYINNPNSSDFKNVVGLASLYSLKHKSFLPTFIKLKAKSILMINKIDKEIKKLAS